jgi:Putative transposase/Transposase zinc-binding domain
VPPAHLHQAAGGRPRWEIADIFRAHGEAYRKAHPLPKSHLKVMRAIERCRTASLGGHIQQCDSCGFQRQAYNSCRNRHCPKCGSLDKARWLEDRKAELLPVGYFHLVFTLPHELNPLALSNKKVVCDILFKAVSQTLLEFARTHLGGLLGFICVLHTWDQTLRDHFHLHCLIPAGALAFDRSQWIPAREGFLFPVRALSLVFRGKFLDLLQCAFTEDQLRFVGRCAPLTQPVVFHKFIRSLAAKKWVVYAKRPFSVPDKVLDYLGRYTHRVAISNNRILSLDPGRVTFSYRDRRNANRLRSMTLESDEFIRRFLLHVVPDGFMRVRHFGFLANRSKKQNLAHCRELLGIEPQPSRTPKKSARELMLNVTGVDLALCPMCGVGTLIVIGQLPALHPVACRADTSSPTPPDSS